MKRQQRLVHPDSLGQVGGSRSGGQAHKVFNIRKSGGSLPLPKERLPPLPVMTGLPFAKSDPVMGKEVKEGRIVTGIQGL